MLRPGVREYLRLRGGTRSGIASQVDEEIALHIELRTQDLIARGMEPDAARVEAEARFGELARARLRLQRRAEERDRRMSIREWLGGWRQDFGYSARALSREPLLAGVIVLTLGLGIGANATIFGIVDQLLLRGPAHVESPEQLRRVYVTTQQWDRGVRTSAHTGYVTADVLRGMTDFDGVAVYRYAKPRVGRGEQALEQWVGWGTANMFPLLGVRPAVGRFFTEAEDMPYEPERVAVLDYAYWQSMFGGSPDALGRTVVVDDEEFTVIGVAPRGFTGPQLTPATIWLPFSTGPTVHPQWTTTWNAQWAHVLVRLRPGASVEAVNAEATARYRAAAEAAGAQRVTEASLAVLPPGYTEAGTEPAELAVSRWLAGVSVIVLLVACANVINLLLARGLRRRRELAVRLALGVSRPRLARLLLSESLLLAVAGGVVAALLALWGGQFLRSALLPDVQWESALNVRVLLFSAMAVLVTGVAVGLAPTLQALRRDMTDMLKSSTRQAGIERSRLRGTLTVVQAAFALVLLVGAGLFVRSLWNVRTLDLGIEPDRVLGVWTSFLPLDALPEEQRAGEALRREGFAAAAVERLRARPDVAAAAIAVGTPLQAGMGVPVSVPGRDSLPHMPGGGPFITAAGPGYFETVGTRIVRGRAFTEMDGPGSERVAIVNESMARTLWPGEDAIGRCLIIFEADAPCARIVGIATDARRWNLVEEPAFQFYVPNGQERSISGAQILVRPVRSATAFIPELRSLLHALEPQANYFGINPLQRTLDPQLRPWRLGATMFLVFGGLALLIAAIGLYSVIAYGVVQRRTELGVRMALGARTSQIVGMVLRQGVGLVAVGIVVGLPLALFGARRIESLLFNAEPGDALVFSAVGGLLLLVAIVASVVPARRAGRTDPAEALRAE